MKTTLTSLILLVFTLPCFAQWEQLNIGVNIYSFYDVYCISSSEIIAVGSEGTILKSTNGGDTWEQKYSGTVETLWKVQFPTPEIGYIIGHGGLFLKSVDGGETWTATETGLNEGFYGFGLSCLNENEIYVNANGGLIKSYDGGETWNTFNDVPFSREVQFINNNIGFVGNFLFEDNWDNPHFYKTVDGGNSWESISGVAPFHFLDENVGYYYLGGLHKTTDGGASFEELSYRVDEYYSLFDIFVINENTIWGIVYLSLLDGDTSSRGFLKISSNDSENFTEVELYDNNPNLDFQSIHFANEELGFAVGSYNNYGIIWRNGNGLNENMNIQEQENIDLKIYPNPSTQEINVSLQKQLVGTFNVIITDMTGKQVYSQEYANEQNISIKTSHFPKGNYILSVKTKQKIISQKIIVN